MRHRSDRGESSLNTWSVAGFRPRIFCRSTTDSTIPAKTSRSFSRRCSWGPTAGSTWPCRSISTRNVPGKLRRPACSMVFPIKGLPGSTIISTVYSRGSSVGLMGGCRTGRILFPTSMMYPMPTIAQGKPTQVISNNCIGSRLGCANKRPFTTRLVLVPISVHVPPRMAA